MSKAITQFQQLTVYPRCRIQRSFVQNLLQDRNIRTGGSSGLFYYVVLCSYANFRVSYRNIEGTRYTVRPGEWVCSARELCHWFRVPLHRQAFGILESLQTKGCITYTPLAHGKVVKYRVCNWRKENTSLGYACPCQKRTGFFFLSIDTAGRLVRSGRCSELDILLDLWVNAVFNDKNILGSDLGPVVSLRDGCERPILCYAELADRWGISKATVSRVLKKLSASGYITAFSFPGRCGTVIYLRHYVSALFQRPDPIPSQTAVARRLRICAKRDTVSPRHVPSQNACSPFCVSHKELSVSKSQIGAVMQEIAETLSLRGFSCLGCPNSRCQFYYDCEREKPSPVLLSALPTCQVKIACEEQAICMLNLQLIPAI